ncbi:Hypothetical predicted protein [Paramuricea clavata]|uniref:Uncharacterized protein n=1 Tax=Paramuricea clavata TaxID=317549 RepID=A0A7D9DWQ9_PARCT|nr:Hypothetical predicted protein [Paramuricea clavata]
MPVKANEIEVVMKNSGINDEATNEIEDDANDVTASETEGEATEEELSASSDNTQPELQSKSFEDLFPSLFK